MYKLYSLQILLVDHMYSTLSIINVINSPLKLSLAESDESLIFEKMETKRIEVQ